MQVSAKLHNLRRSPRKVRLVADALRGLDAEQARNQLKFLVKGSVPNFEKLLKSAIANAQNNFGLDKDNLFVKDIIVNEGAKLKRWLPRAHGRATMLIKRTSSIEIVLAEKVEGKGRKKIERKHEIKDVKPEDLKKKEKEAEGGKPGPADVAKRGVPAGEAEAEKERESARKEFLDEKKKVSESKGFLKRVFRRKSM